MVAESKFALECFCATIAICQQFIRRFLTTTITIRTDPAIKAQAQKVFSDLGIDSQLLSMPFCGRQSVIMDFRLKCAIRNLTLWRIPFLRMQNMAGTWTVLSTAWTHWWRIWMRKISYHAQFKKNLKLATKRGLCALALQGIKLKKKTWHIVFLVYLFG